MMDRLPEFLASKGAVVIGILLVFLVLERLFPVAKAIGGLRRVGKNLSLGGLNAVLSWAVVVPIGRMPSWRSRWRTFFPLAEAK